MQKNNARKNQPNFSPKKNPMATLEKIPSSKNTATIATITTSIARPILLTRHLLKKLGHLPQKKIGHLLPRKNSGTYALGKLPVGAPPVDALAEVLEVVRDDGIDGVAVLVLADADV